MRTNIDQGLFEVIRNTIHQLGFDLVKVALTDQSKTLEILVDNVNDQNITISDCKKISQNISVLLDVHSEITDKYYLVVSSAGLERPLFKIEDYERFSGREVRIKLKKALNGCGHYKGKILKVENQVIYLEVDSSELAIEFDLIKNANLVLTDDLFKKLLHRNK
jgi:ribosome maturation factor RimP